MIFFFIVNKKKLNEVYPLVVRQHLQHYPASKPDLPPRRRGPGTHLTIYISIHPNIYIYI